MLKSLNIGSLPTALLSLAVMLLAGFLVTRLTKLVKLPNVTAYIIAGLAIGPYALNIIPADTISSMDFLTDIALAFIAFGAGRYLKISKLLRNGPKVVVISIAETLVSGALVFTVMLTVFKMDITFALLLGAIASATAPASTIMTIRQYKARGTFVDMLLEVIALDNLISLIAFSIATAVVNAIRNGSGLDAKVVLQPVLLNVGSIVLGIIFGILLRSCINERRTQDNRLILAIAMLLSVAGLCAAVNISPLLACMAMGATYINTCDDDGMFEQIASFSPPILCLFFVLSGMKVNIPSLLTGGIVSIVYCVVRVIGKYAGSFVGGVICRAPRTVKSYFGLALIPQAGVAVGLALLGQRILPEAEGSLLSTIILASSVLYEIVGPACAKWSLQLSGSIESAKPVSLQIEKPSSEPEEACKK